MDFNLKKKNFVTQGSNSIPGMGIGIISISDSHAFTNTS